LIVLLDATVIVSDPNCTGVAWRILAHRPRGWKVDPCVTEVVFAEAVAGFGRRIDEAVAGLDRWTAKHAGALGLMDIVKQTRERTLATKRDYADHLRARLEAAGVRVIPVVEVPHMELVSRATKRIKPCDGNGNGYRDTLNWLTLISLAKENPDHELVWVSGNTLDFADESSSDLHPQLASELAESSVSNIRWVSSLQQVALQLSSTLGAGPEPDLNAVERKLRDDATSRFVFDEALRSLPFSLDVAKCGLPWEVDVASVGGYQPPKNINLAIVGTSGNESVARFTAEFECLISLTPKPGLQIVDHNAFLDPAADGGTFLIEKDLIMHGILSLGSYGEPTACELTGAEAHETDPGRLAWELANAAELVRRRTTLGRREAERLLDRHNEILFRQASEHLKNLDVDVAVQRALADLDPNVAVQRAFAKLDPNVAVQRAFAKLDPNVTIQRALAQLDPNITVQRALDHLRNLSPGATGPALPDSDADQDDSSKGGPPSEDKIEDSD
jgi:hypothetical protein